MKAPRRAVPTGASSRIDGVRLLLRAVILLLTAALALAGGALALLTAHMARRVVTPAGRAPDTKILGVDVGAQTITLSRNPDTVLPGRYGLFTTGSAPYVKLGTVLSVDEHSVTRKLLTHVAADARLAPDAAFSGWYYDRPDQLHLPYRAELVGSAVGPCPAWIFPAAASDGGESDTWVIQIHGRGTTRAECLRAVPVFHARGITSMLVSYRNDGEAPRSRGGSYGLGATEWRDVDAAIGVARRSGARRIVVMGWSMGGAIALQLALQSAHRDVIVGIVLESPVIDWRPVLAHQARLNRLPDRVAQLAIGTLGRDWSSQAVGSEAPIPFDRLDIVTRAAELRHPILILHSDDDGFVPSVASHALVAARPDLVEMQTFDTARHTKLWNYDQDRWSAAIVDWLGRHDVADRGGRTAV